MNVGYLKIKDNSTENSTTFQTLKIMLEFYYYENLRERKG